MYNQSFVHSIPTKLKSEVTITYHILFYLKHCPFRKKTLVKNLCSFRKSHCFYEFTMGKSMQASFQSVWCIGMPKRIRFHSHRGNIHYILSTSDYFAFFFVKTDFVHLLEIIYRVLWSEYCIFSKIGPVLNHWNNFCNIFFLSK